MGRENRREGHSQTDHQTDSRTDHQGDSQADSRVGSRSDSRVKSRRRAGTMERAVTASLRGAGTAGDRAAGELAKTHARAIDGGDDLVKHGPALLACLESMLLTPRARAVALRKGTTHGPAGSPLDELRDRRARRDGPPALDAAAERSDP